MENINQGFDFHKKKEKNNNKKDNIENETNVNTVESITIKENTNKENIIKKIKDKDIKYNTKQEINIDREYNKDTFWETDLEEIKNISTKIKPLTKINENFLKNILNKLLPKNTNNFSTTFDYENIRIEKQEEINMKLKIEFDKESKNISKKILDKILKNNSKFKNTSSNYESLRLKKQEEINKKIDKYLKKNKYDF